MMKVITITYNGQTSIGPQQGYKWIVQSAKASVNAAVSSSTQYFQLFDQSGIRLLDFSATVSSAATYTASGGLSNQNVGPNPSAIAWAYPVRCTATSPLLIGSSLASGTTVTIVLNVEEVIDE